MNMSDISLVCNMPCDALCDVSFDVCRLENQCSVQFRNMAPTWYKGIVARILLTKNSSVSHSPPEHHHSLFLLYLSSLLLFISLLSPLPLSLIPSSPLTSLPPHYPPSSLPLSSLPLLSPSLYFLPVSFYFVSLSSLPPSPSYLLH